MRRALAAVVLLLLVAIALAGCSASFSTAHISNAVLAKDAKGPNYDPVDPTSAFPTDQAVIHLVVTVKNAPSGTKLRAVWTVVDVGDAAAPGRVIDKADITMDNSGSVDFTLSVPSTGVWPVGKYKVDVYLNDKFDKTLEYTISQSATTKTS